MGAGKIAEALGGRSASHEAAENAFAAGHNVLLFPGGDFDGAKAWDDRNLVSFHGRSGFARQAIDTSVPIVPIVPAGAGESLFVISDGRRLARALQLRRLARLKVLPVSASIPWGINIGVSGTLPYLALPTKLKTAVLPPVYPQPGELAEEFAGRVEAAMQERLDKLTAGRKPSVG